MCQKLMLKITYQLTGVLFILGYVKRRLNVDSCLSSKALGTAYELEDHEGDDLDSEEEETDS